MSAKVEEWADEYVKAIDIDDLLKTEQDIVPKLVRVWGRLDDKQLSQLKAASSEAWGKIVAEIPPEDLAALKTAIQTKLDIAKRIADRLKSITLEDVSKWSKEQWDRVPIDNLASMSWSALQKVPLTELGQWVQVRTYCAVGVKILLFIFLDHIPGAMGQDPSRQVGPLYWCTDQQN